MRNALQNDSWRARPEICTRHHALTELAGCAGFPAELLDPGIETARRVTPAMRVAGPVTVSVKTVAKVILSLASFSGFLRAAFIY
jgi:hypothetical protein